MLVYVTPIEGAAALNTTSVYDPLVKADTAWRYLEEPNANPLFEPHMVGRSSRAIPFTDGVTVVPSVDANSAATPDLVVVPGLADDVVASMSRNSHWVPLLAKWHAAGSTVASSCTGAFLLAEAGLLSGRRATTHWVAAPLFRASYPSVELLVDRIVVDEGDIITSGGATTALNLVHYLVSRFGSPARADATTRMLLLDSGRESQLPFVVGGLVRDHSDAVVASAQSHIGDALESASVTAVAAEVGVSARTLNRRFRAAIDMSPRDYIELVRIEQAKRMLAESNESVDRVRTSLGFLDPTAFRRAFRRVTGLTPSGYRRRFGSRVGGNGNPLEDQAQSSSPSA